MDNNNNPYTETPTGDEGQYLRCTSIEKSDGDPRVVIRIQKSVYKDGRKHLFPGSEIAVTQVPSPPGIPRSVTALCVEVCLLLPPYVSALHFRPFPFPKGGAPGWLDQCQTGAFLLIRRIV